MKKQHFLLTVFLYVVAVFYLVITTPISPHEAKTFYTSHDLVSTLMHWGHHLFSGLFGLRVFFILFGFLSISLFYEFSRRYFEKREDAYLATFIFMLLPGIITGSTLANVAIIILPLVLLFVLLYEKQHFILLPFIMLALFFIHEASIIFFIALLIYGVIHKDKKLSIVSASFLLAFIYLAKGIEISGRPSGHFAEIFGLYAAVFSPFVFIYFFYTMYRILLREKKNLTWFISFTALAFSLLLSVRQRVHLTDFAPYVTIAIVLMLDTYNHSLRVRLPQFQKRYRLGFKILIASLIFGIGFLLLHQVLFYTMEKPKIYFAKHVYKPYLLAKTLKAQHIKCYDTSNIRQKYQLQYYNIPPCRK